MKKLFLIIFGVLLFASSAKAINPTYRGFGEIYTGYAVPSNNYYFESGPMFGLSTSHGVSLIEGLFVGVGIDGAISFFKCGRPDKYGNLDSDYSGFFAAFAESRYNILRTKRVSPFVGLRLGGGYTGYDEVAGIYFSPAVGCTFNFTKKFGMDVSLGYTLFGGDKGEDEDSYYNDYAGNINCVTFRVGVHF